MTSLSDQQKQLLFDYSLGIASEREAAQAEQLLSRNQEAADLYRTFQLSLAPLDELELEPCPDELSARLFGRIAEVSRQTSGAGRMQELLAAERFGSRRIKLPLWRNWSEVITAAAAVLLFLGILFPSVGLMRQRYAQSRCGTQLTGIYEGYNNYASDHDGFLPVVAITPGSPWWKVGYQGRENYSNTRQVWPLVRYGYVAPERFLCPGRREAHPVSYDGIKTENFPDFPSRIYIHFSVPVPCPSSDRRDLMGRRVLLADRNPLFEELPADFSELCSLLLSETQMRANSGNHRSRGQNVLLYDGSVEFTKERHTSLSEDDIYVLREMHSGSEVRGCELPSCDADIFLGP
ncbi:MAG: hypothetical protein MUC88_22165 [Planctomycetes bacterium]|nr:hypothetical protein [Planctomycetota bacterium]